MLELEHGFRVVDTHVRLEPDADQRSGDGPGTPERLEREMHQAGIVRSLVYPGERDGSYLKANNAIARMSVGRPFVALARINGPRDPTGGTGARLRNLATSRAPEHTAPEDIEQFAYDDRFVGFKVHPPADGLPDEAVIDALEAVGLPVLVHGGQAFGPDSIERTLLTADFPTIIAHFGGYPLDRDRMARTIALLDDHDDLYLDTSFVRLREPLERALREHPDRVLFGSGAPSAHPSVAIMEILTLDVPEDAMRKAFSNNPGRVIDALAP
ncbi:amidohydrolase family protein [Halorhabdus sp. BNX81]|uniref:amidohydrolase family protein n=1 Tax=Halorhabdus sp. BNX81 TaxID=2980181 RepID=UPI0023DD5FEF|nr:amidohydrolase family protein [Halorhabdus sp. BNX81]WEL21719.1 Putative metal-dependent hydrolase of the TIM-barrel fold [Halorhabdus sp. BNX81]